uniref:Glycerophosphodiester phosphodiesterase GDPD6 isoform X2 n=1 Tax=Rhizophora mucronata TaxID=61149 RepID=A0A2P2KXT6_RHIMU
MDLQKAVMLREIFVQMLTGFKQII